MPHITAPGRYRLVACVSPRRCRGAAKVLRVLTIPVTLATAAATNDPRPSFSGRAAAGGLVTVNVSAGGRRAATLRALPAADGGWSARADSPLPDGAYVAQAQQTDTLGRTRTSAAQGFRVDTTAPSVSLDHPAGGATVATAGPALDGSRGTATGDGEVVVSLYAGSTAAGAPLATLAPSYSAGRWSAAASALADGTYTARAEQRDDAGNAGVSAPATFLVDANGPAVSLSSPPNGSFTTDTTPAFDGGAGDAPGDSATVTVRITQGATVAQTLTTTRAGSAWSTVAAPLGDGAYVAQASQPDGGGHTGTSASHVFTVDTQAPSATLAVTPPGPDGQGNFYATMPTVHVIADDDNFAAVACTVDGTPQTLVNQPGSPSHAAEGDVPVTGDGAHIVRCTASDRAGLTTTPPDISFSVDSAAPSIAISTPSAGATTSDQTPTLTGTAGTASGDSTSVDVKIYAGTATSGSAVQTFSPTRDGSGNWSTAAATTLPVGTYTAVATQSDAAGNSSSATRTFKTPAVMLAAGDIASCAQTGDTQTASLLSANPADKVAALGDNAYEDGSPTDFTNCYGPTWGLFKANTAPAAGNHEYQGDPLTASGYFGYFGAAAGTAGEGWYSYDLGDWHVIVLNSSNACNPVACAAGPQRAFLQNDLATHSNQCTLAYWHHPLFTSDSNAFAGATSQVKPFWDDLYAAGADVVVNGHSHIYERFAPQTPMAVASASGIREFIVGTGGYTEHTVSAPVANSEALNNDTFGVLRLVLRPAGYSWQFLPVAGKTFTDAGSGTCH